MIPRLARWIGLGAAGVAGAIIAFAGVAFGTSAGRDVVVGALLRAANNALRGTVTIDSYRGSVYRGLVLSGVRVEDENGVALASIERVQVRYRLRDLLSRRVVLGAITLTNPQIDLIRQENGRFNYQEVLGLGGDDDAEDEGGGGPGPLIAFRDVRIDSALVTIRQHDDTAGTHGSRIEIPEAELDYFRIQSPLPTEKGIRIEIASLVSRTVNLPLDVRSVRGNIGISGDTISLDVDEVRLPRSRAALRGWIYPGNEVRVDLDIDGDRLVTAELRDLLPWLPDGVAGRGRIVATSLLDDQVRVDASDLALATADGRLDGDLGFLVGPGDAWAAEDVDVTTTTLDLDYLRGFIDSIPFRGRLSGRTVADGPRERLAAEVDWEFEDALADSAITELVGSGVIVLGGEDLVFDAFSVQEGTAIPLATVRALVPAVALRGVLEAVGTLDGPLHNAEFRGVTHHYFGALAPTVAGGAIRLDTRGDTLGVFGDLVMDSLRFETIRPSYPALRVAGAYAGEISISGYATGLRVGADLRGADGRIQGEGEFVAFEERLGFRDLGVTFRRVSLDPVHAVLPRTRVSGILRGRLEADRRAPPVVDLTLDLNRFAMAAIQFDSGMVRVRSVDSVLHVDSLAAWAPGTSASGSGTIAVAGTPDGSVAIRLDSDSVGIFRAMAARFTGRSLAVARRDSMHGVASGTVVLGGSLEALTIDAAFSGDSLRWNDVTAMRGRLGLALHTVDGAVDFTLDVDSMGWRDMGFAAVEADVEGVPGGLSWGARSSLGEDGAFLVGGRADRGEVGELVVRFDSLAILLADRVWFVQSGASAAVTDSSVALSGAVFTTSSGGSRVELDGRIPRRGRGELQGSIEGLAVRDLRALMQLPLESSSGDVGGTFTLGGSLRRPTLRAAVQIRDFTQNDFRAPLTVGQIDYRARRLTGDVSLMQGGEEILNVDVSLPLDLAVRGADRRKLPGALEIRARADGVDLGFLDAVNTRVRNASGQFWTDLGITGEWDRPELTGFLRIADGAASFPALGVRHERIDGQLRLSGDTIHVDRFAVAAGDGTADVGG